MGKKKEPKSSAYQGLNPSTPYCYAQHLSIEPPRPDANLTLELGFIVIFYYNTHAGACHVLPARDVTHPHLRLGELSLSLKRQHDYRMPRGSAHRGIMTNELLYASWLRPPRHNDFGSHEWFIALFRSYVGAGRTTTLDIFRFYFGAISGPILEVDDKRLSKKVQLKSPDPLTSNKRGVWSGDETSSLIATHAARPRA